MRDGWLLLPEDAVPERWKARAIKFCLVPLLPREAEGVLAGEPAVPELRPEDEPLLGLVARGLATTEIAVELGISPRTVERRLAALRRRLGVGSTADLARLLARRGF